MDQWFAYCPTRALPSAGRTGCARQHLLALASVLRACSWWAGAVAGWAAAMGALRQAASGGLMPSFGHPYLHS